MGPDLMDEMRAQAAALRRRASSRVTSRPSTSRTARSASRPTTTSITRRALIIATGASARWLGLPSERKLVGPRRLQLRDLRRRLLQEPSDRRRRRRRHRDGRGDLPHALRLEGDGRPPARDAARVENHAGQGVRQPEDRVRLEQRGRRHPGRRQGRGDRRRAAQRADRRAHRAGGGWRVRRDRPRAEHRALQGQARAEPERLHRDRRGRRRASKACSPAATCRTSRIARPSPPPAQAAWPRSMPSATSSTPRIWSTRRRTPWPRTSRPSFSSAARLASSAELQLGTSHVQTQSSLRQQLHRRRRKLPPGRA